MTPTESSLLPPPHAPQVAPAPRATLTPSEWLLLLAATPGAGAAPDAPAVVHVPDDARVHEMVVAALLAIEAAGDVTFETGSAKRLFGLRTVQVTRVRPTARAGAAQWPEHTLEARALAAAIRLAAKQKHELAEVCDALVDLDASPETEVVARMIRALVSRGLVAERDEQRTVLKVFRRTQRTSVVTPAAAAELRRADVAPAAELLEECRRTRPTLWAALDDAVTSTFTRKTQTADTSDFSGGD